MTTARRAIWKYIVAHLLCLLSACAHRGTGARATDSLRDASSLSATAIVQSYLTALNRRDLLYLTAYLTPDVEWYSMVNGERILEAAGREPLARLLEQYFAKHRHTRWTIDATLPMPNAVAVIERSEWGEREPYESRSSLGVYELRDGRIRRVTYFFE